MTVGEAPNPTRAPQWRELGPLGKIARMAAFVFVATFLALGVAKSLSKEHWLVQRVAPLEQKVWPLRLGSRWRMFVGEARFGYIVLETEVGEGDRYQLESFRWEGKPWWDRARDRRLRKIQAKLKHENHRRRWGRYYLSFVCRTTQQELPGISTIEVIRKRPLILDDAGKRRSRPSSTVIARFDCKTGRFTASI